MRLSIIVPVYNLKNLYEDKCISFESLRNQTAYHDDYEVIIVNDASTDDSITLVRKYENESDIFRVIDSPENRNGGGAINQGLMLARGDYVAFMDQDDWVSPEFVKKMLNAVNNEREEIVCCDWCTTDNWSYVVTKDISDQNIETGKMNHDKIKNNLIHMGHITAKLYSRDLFIDDSGKLINAFLERNSYPDCVALPVLIIRARSVTYIPEVLYYYFENPHSVTHTWTINNIRDRLEAEKVMLRKVREMGRIEEFGHEIEHIFTGIFYINTLLNLPVEKDMLPQCISLAEEMRREMNETFPKYQKNPYYKEFDILIRFFIAFHRRSNRLFWMIYKGYHKMLNIKHKVMK